jgi:hypothetical protein
MILKPIMYQVLYVDRFPHLTNGGAPRLPEVLWIFKDEVDPFKSRALESIIPEKEPTLVSPTAFPVYSMSPTSFLSKDHNKILSHPVRILYITCFGSVFLFYGYFAWRYLPFKMVSLVVNRISVARLIIFLPTRIAGSFQILFIGKIVQRYIIAFKR